MTIFSNKAVTAGALALALSFIAVPLAAQSQETQPLNPQAAEAPGGTLSETDENALLIGDAPAAAGTGETTPSSSFFALLRVVLVLALLCAGVWGIMVFLRKSTLSNVADDPYLKSVANLSLGTNRSAQVLTVGNRAFLVGVTDRSISLISELNDQELIDAMNLAADKNSSVSVAGFSAVIASFIPGMKKPRSAPADTAEGPAFGAELIRRQRERLLNSGAPQNQNREEENR